MLGKKSVRKAFIEKYGLLIFRVIKVFLMGLLSFNRSSYGRTTECQRC